MTLRFARVAFGVSSSPFLLNATLKHHIEGFAESYPRLVETLLRSFYVDDVICGAADEDEAYQLYAQAKDVLNLISGNSSRIQVTCKEESTIMRYTVITERLMRHTRNLPLDQPRAFVQENRRFLVCGGMSPLITLCTTSVT